MTMTPYFPMADGDDPMAKKDHYRKHAAYMLDLASRASSHTDKLRLLVMAEASLDMAVCTHRVARQHDNGPKGSGCVAMILSEAKKYHIYARECLKLAEADETDVPEWLIELSRIWMNAALTEEMHYFNKIEGQLDDRFHDSGPCSGTSDAKMRELQRPHMIRMLETLD
jgi:hypothetical protein